MPARLTNPNAQAASPGLNPTSTRYFVWCICTAYQSKSPQKYPTVIHQKRSVRMARASVQSTATQAASTTFAVPLEPEIFGPPLQQEVERRQQRQHQDAHRPAGGAPAGAPDESPEPGQQDDRAHADAREGEAHGQTPPAHEPVGEEERLTRIAETDAAATDEHAEGGVEVPRLAHQ